MARWYHLSHPYYITIWGSLATLLCFGLLLVIQDDTHSRWSHRCRLIRSQLGADGFNTGILNTGSLNTLNTGGLNTRVLETEKQDLGEGHTINNEWGVPRANLPVGWSIYRNESIPVVLASPQMNVHTLILTVNPDNTKSYQVKVVGQDGVLEGRLIREQSMARSIQPDTAFKDLLLLNESDELPSWNTLLWFGIGQRATHMTLTCRPENRDREMVQIASLIFRKAQTELRQPNLSTDLKPLFFKWQIDTDHTEETDISLFTPNANWKWSWHVETNHTNVDVSISKEWHVYLFKVIELYNKKVKNKKIDMPPKMGPFVLAKNSNKYRYVYQLNGLIKASTPTVRDHAQ